MGERGGERERYTHAQRKGSRMGGGGEEMGKERGKALRCVWGGGATRERKTETEEMGREQRGEPKGLGEKG